VDRNIAASQRNDAGCNRRLRPNAIYKLKINGQLTDSLRADKTGRIQFDYKCGYAVPQIFELDLAAK
jgi:hypothetical protein